MFRSPACVPPAPVAPASAGPSLALASPIEARRRPRCDCTKVSVEPLSQRPVLSTDTFVTWMLSCRGSASCALPTRDVLVLSDEETRLLQTLEGTVPPAAEAYKQGMADLAQKARNGGAGSQARAEPDTTHYQTDG